MSYFLFQVGDFTDDVKTEKNELFPAMISPEKPSQGGGELAENLVERLADEASYSASCGYSRIGSQHQCSTCDYSTAVKSNMKTHVYKHTGEKPYKCDMCDYMTAHKSNLVNHLRTHTGNKPYQCDVCDYKTAAKSSLVRHSRTHTGVKPYQCDVCSYKTADKSKLVKHSRTCNS